MDIKPILNAAIAAESAALAGENIKVLKKKKITTKDMLKMGMTNTVGISLIKAQADIVGGL